MTARSFRTTTRGSLGEPRGLNSPAERMLRKIEAAEKVAGQNMSVTTARLDRNEMGEFLVSALAAELYPELGINIPKFPITGRQILNNMDSAAYAPDPVWKNRRLQYRIPHPGIVFQGVVWAKNEAVKTADQIVQSGWAEGLVEEFERARAKVRAGQILVDFLHFLEGKNDPEFRLGSAYVAEDLITEICFATAAEQEVTLRGIHIRPTSQFMYNELMENLGGSIEVNAFEGALEYRYDLRSAAPSFVVSAVRSIVLVAEGKGSCLDEETRKRIAHFTGVFANLSEDEKRLVVYSAGDVLDDLQNAVDTEKAQAALAGATEPVTEEVAVETA